MLARAQAQRAVMTPRLRVPANLWKESVCVFVLWMLAHLCCVGMVWFLEESAVFFPNIKVVLVHSGQVLYLQGRDKEGEGEGTGREREERVRKRGGRPITERLKRLGL